MISGKITWASSEDSDQPLHPHMVTWVFTVGLKTLWILGHPKSALRSLVRTVALRKHAYTSILNISSPKTDFFSDKILLIFFMFLLKNIDCGNSLEPPRLGGSNEHPQSMFLSRNKKTNVYPLNKSGIKGGQNYIGMFSWCWVFAGRTINLTGNAVARLYVYQLMWSVASNRCRESDHVIHCITGVALVTHIACITCVRKKKQLTLIISNMDNKLLLKSN